MIGIRTPLRVSFVWWGSDLASFYRNHGGGAVVSTSINKSVYIYINKKFDGKVRLSYSKTEIVDHPSQLQHGLAKEILEYMEIDHGIEIVSIADIPSEWSWLGSSSSYTTAMLHGLHTYKDHFVSKETLAKEACIIEIDKCKEPIGKQDQYAAAYGGLNLIEFHEDDRVSVHKIICQKETKKRLEENCLMMYTGITRSASGILQAQNTNMLSQTDKTAIMKKMVGLAYDLKKELENNNLNSFGEILHENWILKTQMAGWITNPMIDERYNTARRSGAIGGKILGAGGWGFLLLYAPKEKHPDIIESLPELRHVPFAFDNEGSTVTFYSQ